MLNLENFSHDTTLLGGPNINSLLYCVLLCFDECILVLIISRVMLCNVAHAVMFSIIMMFDCYIDSC